MANGLLRSRGQEETIKIIIDDDEKGGTFARVLDFDHTPRTDLTETDFLGESESEIDTQHHGHDFAFNVHESDDKAIALLEQIANACAAGVAVPNVTIIRITKYRTQGVPSKSTSFLNAQVKLDKRTTSGRKEYIKNAFSGKCKRIG